MAEVVVVGAGAVGAAVAYYLSAAGVTVHVLEARQPASGASGTSFSVDISTRKTPREFFDLSIMARLEHVQLASDIDVETWSRQTPALEWALDPREQVIVRERVSRLNRWEHPAELITASDARQMDPALRLIDDPSLVVAHYPSECWHDALAMVRALLDRAVQLGATVQCGCTVNAIETVNGRVAGVGTNGGLGVSADVVVNCAGAGAGVVAGLVGSDLPILHVPGLVAVAAPEGPPMQTIVFAPQINVRPDLNHRVRLHSYTVDRDLEDLDPPISLEARFQSLRALAAHVLPTIAKSRAESVAIAVRPVPPDGLPVIGFETEVSGLYHVVSHSGVHLAPILGRVAVDEITGNRPRCGLDTFRPSRLVSRGTPEILDESSREMAYRLANHGAL